ncbi:MAG: selenocysteine-specific translation elongation factor [Burkholderiales bacterium]|nr:selenocysteine-specific translation elongation factor [Burkholderiales bacterium]
MIVGTAGHVDHGKTALVRALTGVDTDRLKEEKARGISIELGYAYVEFDGGVLGFVDVPGHERLIHTMVAGACGIDFVLLVIAADDGVMPQTREHLAIVELLGIARGAVVLTKCDRVDPARVRQVRDEVEKWLTGTVLAGSPIFEVCATRPGDGGIADLDSHLRACVRDTRARSGEGLFRLAVDRVFTLAGVGTIVTGTVFDGSVRVGDDVWIAPRGDAARIRSLHAYHREADAAYAGDRCALNLGGIGREQIERGDWVVCERLSTGSHRLDVELIVLDEAVFGLRQETRFHVHLGAMHRVARAVAIDELPVAAKQAFRTQLVFDEPVCAIAGDRLIVRDVRAVHTVGGGRVLDPFGPARKRRSPERKAWLDAMSQWLDSGATSVLIKAAPIGLRRSAIERSLGVHSGAAKLPEDAVVIPIKGEGGRDDWLIDRQRWTTLSQSVVEVLSTFHASSPDEQGIESGRLRRIMAPQMEDALWRACVDEWLKAGDVERSGGWLHLPSYTVALSDDELQRAQRILKRLHDGGVEPAWVRDVASSVGAPEDQVRAILRKLARRGEVYQIVRDLFYDSNAMREAAHVVERVAVAGEGRVTAAAFRDATGLGRKRAIQVLEFFDRVGLTRFCRDVHLLRDGPRVDERF